VVYRTAPFSVTLNYL